MLSRAEMMRVQRHFADIVMSELAGTHPTLCTR